MEQYNTLNVTLCALFDQNSLKNWSIFDDLITGTTIVKLRFTKSENGDMTTPPQSFRRKSNNQVARDRDRAVRHRAHTGRMSTRSQVAAANADAVASIEIPRHAETISVSDTARSLECSPVVPLNPEAYCFSPQLTGLAESVGHDSHNSTANDNISLESLDTPEELRGLQNIETNNIPVELAIDIPDDICKQFVKKPINLRTESNLDISDDSIDYDDGFTCDDMGCGYGPGGRYDGNNENISFCTTCQCYICLNCLEKGRHARHKLFITPCDVT